MDIYSELTAVGYMRRSRKPYLKYNVGMMATQKKCIKDYCKKNNIRLVESFMEVTTGGNNDLGTRPSLNQALEYLFTGKASILITSDVDRLTRNKKFIEEFINKVLPNYTYIAVNDKINTSIVNNHSKLIKKVNDAARELKNIRNRLRRSFEYSKSHNLYHGGNLRYGTEIFYKNGHIYLNQKEQIVIKNILYLKSEIGLTYQAIADELNNRGIPTKRGMKWNRGTVWRIIKYNENK